VAVTEAMELGEVLEYVLIDNVCYRDEAMDKAAKAAILFGLDDLFHFTSSEHSSRIPFLLLIVVAVINTPCPLIYGQ
jgi:hypothetical protein